MLVQKLPCEERDGVVVVIGDRAERLQGPGVLDTWDQGAHRGLADLRVRIEFHEVDEVLNVVGVWDTSEGARGVRPDNGRTIDEGVP